MRNRLGSFNGKNRCSHAGRRLVNFAPEKHSVELREIPRPNDRRRRSAARSAAVGVCGSDLHKWTAEHSWPVNYPVVLGHEFCRRGARSRPQRAGLGEGDRGVSETAAVIDLDSPLTRQGLYNSIPTGAASATASTARCGASCRVPARILHHMPDGDAVRTGRADRALLRGLQRRGRTIRASSRATAWWCSGPGPIGILCGAMARLCGADVAVVGLERDRPRLEVARQYGLQPIAGDARGLGTAKATAWASTA